MSDGTYYRLPIEKQIKPKVFFDNHPIKAEPMNGEVIKTDKTQKQEATFSKNEKIKDLDDRIEKHWKTGNYDTKEFNPTPFRNPKNVKKFFTEDPIFTIQEPPFVPSNKIYLSNEAGLEKQWQTYYKSIGKM